MKPVFPIRVIGLLTLASLVAVGCSSNSATEIVQDDTIEETVETTLAAPGTDITADEEIASTGASTFTAEVWADNWFSLSVNGALIGEDSVPITTERSFNAETFTFDATYPLTIAIEAKDFKETDSGLEYIGEGNQQMGDGGIIAQLTDTTTGEVVAVTGGDWSALVLHRAPLNTDCEKDSDPDATCEFEITETPTDWTAPDYDDSSWEMATEWSEADVSPKDGYDEISWDDAAALIWGPDLEVDNTVLLRSTIG
jgi:hypothetical protein